MISLATQVAVDPVVGWTLRIFLAAVFARALYGKLRAPHEFAEAIRGYEILPDRAAIAGATGAALLSLELAIVVGLLLRPLGIGSTAALGAAGLLAVYSAAIALNLARGRRDIDCGCAGPGKSAVLHEWLLVRNGCYIAMALGAALPSAAAGTRELIWLDATTIALAVVSLGTLALAVEALVALAPLAERNRLPR